jgi:hypothetical protein
MEAGMPGEVSRRGRALRFSDIAEREIAPDPLGAARGVINGCILVIAVIAVCALLIAL